MRAGIHSLLKSQMNPKDLKPIEFRQLCALLRSILQAEATIDDAEWKARAMDTMAKWGFEAPKPEQMGRAMSAVEQAMKQTIGPRPIRATPEPDPVGPPRRPEIQKETRNHNPPGWSLVVGLMAKLQRSASSEPSLPAPTTPRETLPLDEVTVLDEFWRASWLAGANRLELLKAFAEIAIVRPADWDYAAVREHAHDKGSVILSAADGCFACHGESSHWHHVIQIQFGGSNYVRNFVPLCAGCHSAIHPWLPFAPKAGQTGGWSQIGDVGADLLERLRHRVKAAS